MGPARFGATRDGATLFLGDPEREILDYMASVGLTDPKWQWPRVETVWRDMFDR